MRRRRRVAAYVALGSHLADGPRSSQVRHSACAPRISGTRSAARYSTGHSSCEVLTWVRRAR